MRKIREGLDHRPFNGPHEMTRIYTEVTYEIRLDSRMSLDRKKTQTHLVPQKMGESLATRTADSEDAWDGSRGPSQYS